MTCKVIRWEIAKLEDRPIQLIPIGPPIIFQAIDLGDAITLSANLQRAPNRTERTERNQRTLIAVSAVLSPHTPGRVRNIPTRRRARQFAAELRWGEWANSANGEFTDIHPNSRQVIMIASLCRVIRNPNRDRDYRSMCIVLSGFDESKNCAIRVFDILRPALAIHRCKPMCRATSILVRNKVLSIY